MTTEIQAEAKALLETIDGGTVTGWDATMWEAMEAAAEDDEEMAETVAMLRHHMDGTDGVRAFLARRLAKLAA